jgi:hypothetical protein
MAGRVRCDRVRRDEEQAVGLAGGNGPSRQQIRDQAIRDESLPHGAGLAAAMMGFQRAPHPTGSRLLSQFVDPEAMELDELRQGRRGEMQQMPRQIECEPIGAEFSIGEAIEIRDRQDESPSRNEQLGRGADDRMRIMHVFEDGPHDDDVESRRLQLPVRKGAFESANAVRFANVPGRMLAEIHRGHVETSIAESGGQPAGAAAEIEDPPAAVIGKSQDRIPAGPKPRPGCFRDPAPPSRDLRRVAEKVGSHPATQRGPQSRGADRLRSLVGFVVRRIVATDRRGIRPRIQEAHSAIPAADEPEDARVRGRVEILRRRRFEAKFVIVRPAEGARDGFPSERGGHGVLPKDAAEAGRGGTAAFRFIDSRNGKLSPFVSKLR